MNRAELELNLRIGLRRGEKRKTMECAVSRGGAISGMNSALILIEPHDAATAMNVKYGTHSTIFANNQVFRR